MPRELSTAAAAVGLHTVANVAHGVPHAEVPVALARWQTAFVYLVVLAAPVVALGLLWRGRFRAGATLLAASMAASLAFGLFFHFVVPNPDHVDAVPTGPWRGPFRATAVLVALSDAVGVAVGVWLLADR